MILFLFWAMATLIVMSLIAAAVVHLPFTRNWPLHKLMFFMDVEGTIGFSIMLIAGIIRRDVGLFVGGGTGVIFWGWHALHRKRTIVVVYRGE